VNALAHNAEAAAEAAARYAVGYRFVANDVCGFVRAPSRGAARWAVAWAMIDAGYYTRRNALDALRAVRVLRRDARADDAPIVDSKRAGLVPNTWAPTAGGAS
jgi:hypothetical protein